MVCPNCYALINPEDEVCGSCGTKLKPSGSSKGVQPQQSTQDVPAQSVSPAPVTPAQAAEPAADSQSLPAQSEPVSQPQPVQPASGPSTPSPSAEYTTLPQYSPGPAEPMPSYLEPGLRAPRKKSRIWLWIILAVILCGAVMLCAGVLGSQFL